MKHLLLSLSLSFVLLSYNTFSQGVDGVLIDPNNATTRDASAVFQAQSTSQGMLVPRMTAAQRGAIPVTAARDGLMVYQTDAPAGFYYYNGATLAWVQLATATGGTGYIQNQVAADQAAGFRINGNGLFNGGSVGIGTTAPGGKLEVVGGPVTLSAGYLDINRDTYAQNGISWYAQNYPSWSTYMSPGGATATGPHADLTAPSGTYVTSWALRNYIENLAGYGWTFESAANTTTPSVKFEIRASDGLFHSYGDGYVDGVVYAGASARMGTGIAGGYYQDATNGAYRAIVGSGVTNGYYFQTNTGAATTMYVGLGGTYNGNVGIGNTTPSAQLHTTGTVRFGNYLNGFLVGDATGALTTPRSIAGTTNQLVVSNGNGVAGNPTVNIDPSYTADLNAGANMTGGGTITWNSSGVFSWTSRFIVISNGSGTHFSTNGYFDISQPANGTVITGVGGAANVTATASGVPLPAWQALYYILPVGSSNVSLPANFRVASYTAGLQVPETWILVALRNGDDNSLRVGNGTTLPLGQTSSSSTGFINNQNSVVQSANFIISGTGRADGDFRSPIFYDQNNTGYYVDPNGLTNLYNLNTLPGFAGYFPANNAIRMTPNFHFNTPAGYATIINWDNGAVGGTTQQFRVGNGAGTDQFYVRADGGAFGRVWYDLDNSGYYLDANSTSDAALRVRGGALFGGNTTWGALLYVGTDGRQNLTNSASPSVAATNGNLHMDAGSGYDMYLNFYDGNQIYFGRGDNSSRGLLNSNGFYLYDGWLRTHNSTGWYNETYGGGMYMVDANEVRVYNSKGLWVDNRVRAIGSSIFAQNNNSALDYSNAAIQLREAQYGATSGYLPPRISFHWGGVVASQIAIESDGTIAIRNNPGTGYEKFKCLTLKSNGFIEPSDARLKNDITPITSALQKVTQMQGVNYYWNKNLEVNQGLSDTKQYGLIAQELEKIIPELVHTDNEGWKSVEYSHLVPLLIESIKEQQAEIESQKTTINSQQKVITTTVDDINFLKNYTKELEAKITAISAEIHTTGNK